MVSSQNLSISATTMTINLPYPSLRGLYANRHQPPPNCSTDQSGPHWPVLHNLSFNHHFLFPLHHLLLFPFAWFVIYSPFSWRYFFTSFVNIHGTNYGLCALNCKWIIKHIEFISPKDLFQLLVPAETPYLSKLELITKGWRRDSQKISFWSKFSTNI